MRWGEHTRGRRIAALCAVLLLFLLVAAGSDAATATPPSAALPNVRALLVRAAAGRLAHLDRLGGVRAAAAPTPCGKPTGVLCTRVQVPLDRSGRVPGSISLHVEVLPAEGLQRGVMFLIAGGPGQGSAHVFGLGTRDEVAFDRFLFPGYTIVAYDDRGTGDSGLLNCPALQSAHTADAERAAAADCAAAIGPSRDFYSTAEHAEDLDAVRQALGYDRIGLYGISYGTKLAMAYALAHPAHVERVLLSSVLPPEGPDPFSADVVQRMPAILRSFCADGGCRAATPDFAGDVVALANSLAAKPLRGTVVTAAGRTKTVQVEGLDVLGVVLDADLNPGLAAELPAVVRAARHGNTQPLLRAVDLDNTVEAPADLSFALYAATVCRDGPFPWAPETPIADRAAIEQAAIGNVVSSGGFGPFGSWAARFGNADFCLDWPSPSGGAALGSGPLPNVPMLAVSGGFDMRTPTAGAAAVVSRFPQGKLLVVPGVGHDTVDADLSGCAAAAVRAWMTDVGIPRQCPRPKAYLPPVSALPAPGAARAGHRAGPAQTYSVAMKTVREAEAAWLMNTGFSGKTVTPGVFGGRIVATSASAFKLVRYSIARGVLVSGTVHTPKLGPPIRFEGTLSVAGPRAASGVLRLSGRTLRGTVGGKAFG